MRAQVAVVSCDVPGSKDRLYIEVRVLEEGPRC